MVNAPPTMSADAPDTDRRERPRDRARHAAALLAGAQALQIGRAHV